MAFNNSVVGRALQRVLNRHPQKPRLLPVTEAIAQERMDVAMMKPWFALAALYNDYGNSTCWYCICFRLIIGQELGTAYFAHDDQVRIEEAFAAMRAVRDRFVASGNERWKATAGEAEMIRVGLILTDQMVDTTSSKEKLDVSRHVHAAMQDTIKQH